MQRLEKKNTYLFSQMEKKKKEAATVTLSLLWPLVAHFKGTVHPKVKSHPHAGGKSGEFSSSTKPTMTPYGSSGVIQVSGSPEIPHLNRHYLLLLFTSCWLDGGGVDANNFS